MRVFHLFEMEWNEADKEAFKNAKPNLDKARENFSKLSAKLSPKKDIILKKIKDIKNHENGQGQLGNELSELQDELNKIEDQLQKSHDEIGRLSKIYSSMMKMVKK